MTSKKLTLYISLIPLFLIIAIILGAGFFLIKDDVDLKKLFSDSPKVRRLEGYPMVLRTTNQLEKQRRVIKSQEELEQFLKAVDPTGNLALGDKINFDKEYLIGVTTQTKTDPGNSIKVKKVYRDSEEEELQVALVQYEMAEGCQLPEDSTIGIDLVAISKATSDIEFDVVQDFIQDCEKVPAVIEYK
jgi:hypothetical protein